MVLNGDYIRELSGDRECIEALAYLADTAVKYPIGLYTPPLTHKRRTSEVTPFLAVSMRLGRATRSSPKARVSRIEWFDGTDSHGVDGSDAEIAASFANGVLCARYSGRLLVTSGVRRHVLDVWLESQGSCLLRLGYSIQPCISGGGVAFAIIRKGKRKWTLTTFEGATGRPVSDGLELAQIAGISRPPSRDIARSVWSAATAYSAWLSETFGVAMCPTAGMIAVSAARCSLPEGFAKWRPDPLLVAMEREGGGYRGGITYARKYAGPSWRIDVTRQYTNGLRYALPLRTAFGNAATIGEHRPGIYMCRVRLSDTLPYPLGVWHGPTLGFSVRTVGRGSYVCVLHSSEFPGLFTSGATLYPAHGFISTATFNFGSYVALLQEQMSDHGTDDPRVRFCKPLGNYVYGKLGQRPDRTELLYSDEKPDKRWWPYYDEYGTPWENVWQREVVKVTSSQHVDVAGTITGAARSQTVSTWAYLQSCGATIARAHTDSLTLDMDPSPWLSTSTDAIGSWRMDGHSNEYIVVGPNAYFDHDGAHIAGVSKPTFEMVERMHDGQTVAITQTMKAPRTGMVRGDREVTRALKATAR